MPEQVAQLLAGARVSVSVQSKKSLQGSSATNIDAVDASQLPGLTGFALHLFRDLDAVTAGLTLDWSSGSIEGAVNRIKRIKRQLYGRAGFELLRKMILLQ
ncbi:transposase [Streptomyces griseoluteus]|uniref:transposase n=1 Tax=Streptomyces griseoluteus TaxID=29306 RepID=UPI003700A1CD